MAVQGFAKIVGRTIPSGKTMYDLIMDNGDKYGLGPFRPKHIADGDYVSFEVEYNGNFKNVARGSLQKEAKPAGAAPASRAAPAAAYAKAQDNRQEIISKQAAANTAIAFVKMAIDTGAIKLPAKNAADTLLAITSEYTAVFYKKATGEEYKGDDDDAADLAAVEAADERWDE